MAKSTPVPVADRDRTILLLRQLWTTKRDLWRACAQPHCYPLFHASLFIEDDSRFNRWFDDLLKILRVPWSDIE